MGGHSFYMILGICLGGLSMLLRYRANYLVRLLQFPWAFSIKIQEQTFSNPDGGFLHYFLLVFLIPRNSL